MEWQTKKIEGFHIWNCGITLGIAGKRN